MIVDKIEKLKKSLDCKHHTVKEYQDIIREFGLVNDESIKDLYGDERRYMLKNRNDLGIYQTPLQFANLLYWLQEKLRRISEVTYLEIGVFRGGTFLFMKYFLEGLISFTKLNCIDPTDNLHESAKPEIEPHLIRGITSDALKKHKYNIVFIDGDHSYEWVKWDYENVGQYTDICILHDIVEQSCQGVMKFWNEIKQTRKYVEFTKSEGRVIHHGIGVLYD